MPELIKHLVQPKSLSKGALGSNVFQERPVPPPGLIPERPSAEQTRRILEEFIANQNSLVTKRNYSYELRRFFSFVGKLDVKELTERDILAYKESMASAKPATIAWKLCAVRQFLAFTHERGHLAKNVAGKVKSPTVHPAEPECLSLLEAQALLNAPDRRTAKGKRDYAILQVMLSTGIRVGELVEAKVGDLGFRYNKPVLNIVGKGKKPRTLSLAKEAHEGLSNYLLSRFEPKKADYLFLTLPRKGVASHRMTTRAIQKMIKVYAKKALIQKDIIPHTLRHTVASLELEGGANVMEIKNQLGHASISVTQRYLHAKRQALERHPLYREDVALLTPLDKLGNS